MLAAAALSAAQAGLSIYSGFAQQKMYNTQAEAARVEGKYAELRGKQVAANKRQELNRVIAAIDTIRSTRGVGLDTPTAHAIRERNREESRTDRSNAALMARLDKLKADNRASSLSQAASLAPITGFANALPALKSAATDLSGAF